jgi:hypothetical protein
VKRGAPAGLDVIRVKLAKDRQLYRHYLLHAKKMLDEEDLHGLWDAAMNASEVHNRMDSYAEALAALGK